MMTFKQKITNLKNKEAKKGMYSVQRREGPAKERNFYRASTGPLARPWLLQQPYINEQTGTGCNKATCDPCSQKGSGERSHRRQLKVPKYVKMDMKGQGVVSDAVGKIKRAVSKGRGKMKMANVVQALMSLVPELSSCLQKCAGAQEGQGLKDKVAKVYSDAVEMVRANMPRTKAMFRSTAEKLAKMLADKVAAEGSRLYPLAKKAIQRKIITLFNGLWKGMAASQAGMGIKSWAKNMWRRIKKQAGSKLLHVGKNVGKKLLGKAMKNPKFAAIAKGAKKAYGSLDPSQQRQLLSIGQKAAARGKKMINM